MKKIISTLMSLTLALFMVGSVAADSTVIVTGNTTNTENTPGWMFNRDLSNATPIDFNNDAFSLGSGSLYVLPLGATPTLKFVGENFLNTPIADINSITYDFKIGPAGVDTQEEQYYINVYANFGVSDDLKYYDCRYDVVPTTGSKSSFTTVTFDPTLSYPVTTRGGASLSPFACPAIPAEMNNLSAGSNIRMFSLNMGDTSAVDQGLDGYFDKVVVNLDSGITTYDFEKYVAPSIPAIELPANGATVTQSNMVKVDWSDSTGGTYPPYTYQYQAYGDAGYTSHIYTSSWLSVSEIPTPGTPIGNYYLRVRAKDNSGQMTEWSNGDSNPYHVQVVANIVDQDGDGVADSTDNCPAVANPAQTDTDNDGKGDTCDTTNSLPPTSKDQCKKDGWKSFDNPTFKNQGECVSYVEHHDGKGHDDDRYEERRERLEKYRHEALERLRRVMAELKNKHRR